MTMRIDLSDGASVDIPTFAEWQAGIEPDSPFESGDACTLDNPMIGLAHDERTRRAQKGKAMSKHNSVAEAFVNCQPATSGHMIGTAHEVFSYRECIAKRTGPDAVDVRTTTFSTTTSRHTNAVRNALVANGFRRVPEQDNDEWEAWTI